MKIAVSKSKYLIIICGLLLIASIGCIEIQLAPSGTTKATSKATNTVPTTSIPPLPTITNTTPPSTPVWTPQPGAVVKTFAASPTNIKSGEASNISWEVTGATKVSIAPNIGVVNAMGTASVRPSATTEYTLSAEGPTGTVTQKITVTLSVEPKPDLIVTRVYLQQEWFYFVARNVGNAPSVPARAQLYVDDVLNMFADTYVDPLAPGQEKLLAFDKYNWNKQVASATVYNTAANMVQYEIKVCVDTGNENTESNENNNCRSILLGPNFYYPFLVNMPMAIWTSSSGSLTLPVAMDNPGGTAFVTGNVLAMYPARTSGGWISGRYAEFYMPDMRTIAYREVVLPRYCRFTAVVGFAKEAPANAKAKFMFMVLDQSLAPVISKEVTLTNSQGTADFDVDLSSVAYKKVTFILRVESLGSPSGDLAIWTEPLISQKW